MELELGDFAGRMGIVFVLTLALFGIFFGGLVCYWLGYNKRVRIEKRAGVFALAEAKDDEERQKRAELS
jgi:hypothetical protein